MLGLRAGVAVLGVLLDLGLLSVGMLGVGVRGRGGGVEVLMMVVLVVVCWECDYWRRMLKVGLLRV